MTRVSTPLIFVLPLLLLAGSQALAANNQINIYATSYAPVAGNQVTITAQFADPNGIPMEDPGQASQNASPVASTGSWSLESSAGGGTLTGATAMNVMGIATITLNTTGTVGQWYTVT